MTLNFNAWWVGEDETVSRVRFARLDANYVLLAVGTPLSTTVDNLFLNYYTLKQDGSVEANRHKVNWTVYADLFDTADLMSTVDGASLAKVATTSSTVIQYDTWSIGGTGLVNTPIIQQTLSQSLKDGELSIAPGIIDNLGSTTETLQPARYSYEVWVKPTHIVYDPPVYITEVYVPTDYDIWVPPLYKEQSYTPALYREERWVLANIGVVGSTASCTKSAWSYQNLYFYIRNDNVDSSLVDNVFMTSQSTADIISQLIVSGGYRRRLTSTSSMYGYPVQTTGSTTEWWGYTIIKTWVEGGVTWQQGYVTIRYQSLTNCDPWITAPAYAHWEPTGQQLYTDTPPADTTTLRWVKMAVGVWKDTGQQLYTDTPPATTSTTRWVVVTAGYWRDTLAGEPTSGQTYRVVKEAYWRQEQSGDPTSWPRRTTLKYEGGWRSAFSGEPKPGQTWKVDASGYWKSWPEWDRQPPGVEGTDWRKTLVYPEQTVYVSTITGRWLSQTTVAKDISRLYSVEDTTRRFNGAYREISPDAPAFNTWAFKQGGVTKSTIPAVYRTEVWDEPIYEVYVPEYRQLVWEPRYGDTPTYTSVTATYTTVYIYNDQNYSNYPCRSLAEWKSWFSAKTNVDSGCLTHIVFNGDILVTTGATYKQYKVYYTVYNNPTTASHYDYWRAPTSYDTNVVNFDMDRLYWRIAEAGEPTTGQTYRLVAGNTWRSAYNGEDLTGKTTRQILVQAETVGYATVGEQSPLYLGRGGWHSSVWDSTTLVRASDPSIGGTIQIPEGVNGAAAVWVGDNTYGCIGLNSANMLSIYRVQINNTTRALSYHVDAVTSFYAGSIFQGITVNDRHKFLVDLSKGDGTYAYAIIEIDFNLNGVVDIEWLEGISSPETNINWADLITPNGTWGLAAYRSRTDETLRVVKVE